MTQQGNNSMMKVPADGVQEIKARVSQLWQKMQKNNDASVRDELQRLLLSAARKASENSYSPYSKFPVGAALLTSEGRLFTGCNVENASYGGAICAERTAIVKAVSEGFTQFEMMAVVCAKAEDTWPCGFCRQFISEFGANIQIIAADSDGKMQISKIAELLPRMFGPGNFARLEKKD